MEQLDNGYRESGGFPGTRLGTSEEIPSGENSRNSDFLNGCRGGVSFVVYSSKNGFYNGKIGKKHEKSWCLMDREAYDIYKV